VKCVPTEYAAEQFLELLGHIQVDEQFTTEFTSVLKEKWVESAGDNTEILRKLRSGLTDLRQTQEELMMKYLKKDPAITRRFDTLNDKLEKEIAETEEHVPRVVESGGRRLG
jgi:hypothetical protein